MSNTTVEIQSADPRSADAAALIAALSEELSRRYDFIDDGSGRFRAEDVLIPGSGFVIARVEGRAVGCGAFRPLEGDVCEIKRMYVLPEHRCRGVARAILAALERLARDAGYSIARLETGDRL